MEHHLMQKTKPSLVKLSETLPMGDVQGVRGEDKWPDECSKGKQPKQINIKDNLKRIRANFPVLMEE